MDELNLYFVDAGSWETETPWTDSEWGCQYHMQRFACIVEADSRGLARQEFLFWLANEWDYFDVEWTFPLSIRKLPTSDSEVNIALHELGLSTPLLRR